MIIKGSNFHLALAAILLVGLTSLRAETPRQTWETALPAPVTSFGACKAGSFIYVYGGHKG